MTKAVKNLTCLDHVEIHGSCTFRLAELRTLQQFRYYHHRETYERRHLNALKMTKRLVQSRHVHYSNKRQ